MYVYTQGHSRVISTGSYLPEERISSDELMQQCECEQRLGVANSWLERVTGILERRVSPEAMLPSDMATAAAKEALERAAILASEIDAIIYTGLTRDFTEPATAHIVQAKLDAKHAIVFDISNACHGFMNGIHLMDALIATGQVRRGLVVTGEQGKLFARKAIEAIKQARDKDELIRLAAGLTGGDAGAAMLMGPKINPESGLVGFLLQSQGQYAGYCTSGGPLQEGPLFTDMPGIVGQSQPLIGKMYREFMQRYLKWNTHELHKYISHQVGATSIRLHHKTTGVPLQIIANSVTTLGNLVTATIPVNLHNITEQCELQSGDKVYLSGAGSGISISQAGMVWDQE